MTGQLTMGRYQIKGCHVLTKVQAIIKKSQILKVDTSSTILCKKKNLHPPRKFKIASKKDLCCRTFMV